MVLSTFTRTSPLHYFSKVKHDCHVVNNLELLMYVYNQHPPKYASTLQFPETCGDKIARYG